MEKLNFFTQITSPIEVLDSNGMVLSHATGFFYRQGENSNYIITNWHVVTGREPTNPTHSPTAAIPTHLKMKVHERVGENQINTGSVYEMTIPINSPDGNSPTWLEHKDHKFLVDVVALELPQNLDHWAKIAVNFLSQHEHLKDDMKPQPMNDVFVIGYPWGLTGGSIVFPIFKRGSVASDPVVEPENLPYFLIDCRTASGMSGAPVIFNQSAIPFGGIGTATNFAGVYSGRLKSRDRDMDKQISEKISEIGIVWNKAAIESIVDYGVSGTKLSDLGS